MLKKLRKWAKMPKICENLVILGEKWANMLLKFIIFLIILSKILQNVAENPRDFLKKMHCGVIEKLVPKAPRAQIFCNPKERPEMRVQITVHSHFLRN